MRSEFRDRLIGTALEKGYLDEERVRAALKILHAETEKGAKVGLHEVLVRYNLMTHGELLDVRRTMAKDGVPIRLGDFDILARLGRGATSTVYLARQRSLEREVAVKLLGGHLAGNAEMEERFFAEARLAAQVSHGNIVHVYDVGDTRHTHYIVMEYVQGETLEAIIEREGRISEERATAVGVQMARALLRIEECGIVHRDIKPGNIMLTGDGTAKLADLGMALAEGGTETGGGTAYYMAPEQARGEEGLDVRTDIYSLGCTLFHAVTGRPPYAGRNAAETLRMHEREPVPDAGELRPGLSAGFCEVLRVMMAKEREGRFSDAKSLLAAWERLAAGSAPEVRVRKARGGGMLWWWALAGAGLIVLLALIWLWLGDWRGGGEAPEVKFLTGPREGGAEGR